jgi:hypothetical protein
VPFDADHTRVLAIIAFTRRRSRRLNAPATTANADATPLGSISGTALEFTETL